MTALQLPEKVFVIQQKRISEVKKTEQKHQGTEVYTLVFEDEESAQRNCGVHWEVAVINSSDLLESISEEKYTAYGLRKYGVSFLTKEGKKTSVLKDYIKVKEA